MGAIQTTAQHWSEQPEWDTGTHWLELPAVQRRLNQRATGDPAQDWVQHTLHRYFAGRLPLARCLSLGCGKGALERRLARMGAFVECDAADVAPGSIAEARAQAETAGYPHIHYTTADVNTLTLPPASYDLVIGNGSVHHFAALEHVFAQVAQALTPTGVFVLNEYVGPDRFQFPPRQREVILACWQLLPSAYRQPLPAAVAEHRRVARQRHALGWYLRRAREKWRDGDFFSAVQRRWTLLRDKPVVGMRFPSAQDVAATDPSEAVRSSAIVPLLGQYFEVVEFKPLGGNILQILLADIAGNFLTPEGEQWITWLLDLEEILLTQGELQSDFAYIVARGR